MTSRFLPLFFLLSIFPSPGLFQAGINTTPVPQEKTSADSKVPDASSYIISSEDQLQVSVWKEPALSGAFPVRPDGKISLTLLGDLTAAGRTPAQLSQEIQTGLKKFINDPNVTVTVVAVHSDKVYMLGEVGHVGAIPLTAGMSPLQAIAAAGGLTPYANAKHIYVLRTSNGKQLKLPYDYKKAVKDGNQQGITLVPNDTVVVP